MSEIAEALAKLRETRDALMRPGAPLRVDLRDYVPEGSAAWRAFVRIRSESARSTLVPGHSVRRATMVGWLEEVIARLEVETAAGETPPSEPVEAPSPRDVPHAGERSSPMEAPAPPRGTPLRRLTAEGIAEAQAFLARLREHPDGDRTPPDELLFGDRYSRPFDASAGITVEPRAFGTRREAGEYLSPLLAPMRHRILFDAGVWSWLGMYYFAGMAPATLSPNNMTFIFESGEDTSNASRSDQQVYRHYLWGSWRLYEQHGENAAFLLDQEISSWDDLSQRSFGSRQVFSSLGMVQLILRLYTSGAQKKRGYTHSPGGLRHLMRVLPQLELTHDVYGMAPDALLEVLPDDCQRWDAR